MKEFTCVHCGRKGIDRRSTGTRKYCSKECADSHWRMTHAAPKEIGQLCFFNDGVLCEKRKCRRCGWNPLVETKRKEALYEGV